MVSQLDREQELRKELEGRMESLPREYSEDERYCLAFNNFRLQLPCDTIRRETLADYLDEPEMAKSGKSLRQFFSDIDEAIETCGIDVRLMTKLHSQAKKDIKQHRELLELVFPVYVALRDKGYTHTDLVQ